MNNVVGAVEIPQKLRDGFRLILMLSLAVAAVYCVVNVISAVIKRGDDPAAAKQALINAVWSGASVLVVYAVFSAVGVEDAMESDNPFN